MADDIDIEEHDVLENPVIRTIFPDITDIKKEINEYFEDGLNIKQDPDKTLSAPVDIEIKAERNASICTNIDNSNVPKSIPKNVHAGFKRTKIILGSKPSINAGVTEDIGNVKKKPLANDVLDREYIFNTNFEPTKLILGSKPQQPTDSDNNKKQANSDNAPVQIPNLMLQDIGAHIYQSKRYCKECKTLFPCNHDYKEHKQIFHVVKPTTNNSNTMNTRKKSLKIRIQLLQEKRSEYKHKCPICGSRFGTLFRLSQHHRNIHEKKASLAKAKNIKNIHKCNICESSFTERNNLNRHLRLFHKKNTTTASHNSVDRKKYKNQLDNRNNGKENKTKLHKSKLKVTPNKCTICNLHFSRLFNLKRHYKNIHNKKVSYLQTVHKPKDRKNTLNTYNNKSNTEIDSLGTLTSCFHCNETFSSQESLIDHIYSILGLSKASEVQDGSEKKENNEPETVNLKHRCVDTDNKCKSRRVDTDNKCKSNNLEPTSSRNKLVFESDDLDEISSLTSKVAQIKNEKMMEKKVLREEEDGITLDKKEGTTESSDDEFIGTDSHSSASAVASSRLKSKRKYESSELYHTESISTKRRAIRVCNSQSNTENRLSSLMKKEAATSECNPKKTKLKPETSNAKAFKSVMEKEEGNKQFLQKKSRMEPKPSNVKTPISMAKEEDNVEFKPKKTQIKLKTSNAITTHKSLITKSKNKRVEHEHESEGVYECIYCSYILPTLRTYSAHIIEKHKVVNISQGFKVTFEKKCRYCPSKTNTIAARNMHVSRYHRKLLTKSFFDESEAQEWEEGLPTLLHSDFKKVKSFVLQSLIYKCSKCDVNFLSSVVANDHEKHMELSVNWKCLICKNVFKKHDKHLHLKQHTFSKTINVCEFNQTELSRLLYNCTKCAIHFTEERYLKHFPNCGIQTTDSMYCKNCDILIDKCRFASHEDFHKMGNSTEDFIVMTGELIIDLKEQEGDKEKDGMPTRRKLYEPDCFTFCGSCKCYLSGKAMIRKAHNKGTCSQMVKYTCELCGLVFTNKTINTHRDYHRKQKDLKLQDFKFFDLKGVQIRPPIPDYHQCNNCEIIFVHKNGTKNHMCSQMKYKVCEICNTKLTESAFKLHMNFHTYSLPIGKESQSLDVSTKIEENIITVKSNVSLAKTHQDHNSTTKDDTRLTENKHDSDVSTDQKETQEQAAFHKLANIKPDFNCKVLTKTGKLIAETALLKTKRDTCKEIIRETKITKAFEPLSKDKNVQKKESESGQVNVVIYTCQTCEISVTSYDEVIEHCQNHFSPKTTIDSTICTICSLKFEADSYKRHEQLHHKNSDKTNDIQFLRFDPTYFTAENTIWTQHVFALLVPSKQNEILDKSKYPPECRIKMDVIQKGPNHLTVYKCNQCGNFIDPDFVVTHLKDKCYRKAKKYPCSICGLPLNSNEYRTKHEQIHKLYDNVRLKSYNIAVINSITYRTFNDAMIDSIGKYVLYQCRVCDGIVDKEQRQEHQCSIDDLQECEKCGLILYKKDFHRHISKHKELTMYKVENMKVILFGRNDHDTQEKNLIPKFNGTICDFKLFKCENCGVCVNDKKWVNRHVCVFDDSKWKCPKCSFYICSRSIEQHIKLHDLEADFKLENMNIILFKNKKLKVDVPNLNNKGIPESEKHKTQSMERDNNAINPIDDNTQVKETVMLYKCACALHFVEETSAKDHVIQCSPKMKIIRQNCSKCNLLFTPKELFTHIIAHHSEKNKTVNYNITEVPNTRDNSNVVNK